MNEYQQEHYVVDQVAPKWLSTALTTMGAALVTGLLIWIASSQLEINTNQAVILSKLEFQETILESDRMKVQSDLRSLRELLSVQTESLQDQLDILEHNQNQLWPRIRAHGENITILKNDLEQLCNCKINLSEPEKF